MAQAQANRAQFHFQCSDLPYDTFGVVGFDGHDTVSKPYHFNIDLVSSDPNISIDDVVGKPASLYLVRDETLQPYSGVIAQFRFIDYSTDYARYSAVLVPRLWLLSLNVQTRVFQKMTALEIIEKVFADAGLAEYYRIESDAVPAEREYVVQYGENDLEFISRIMENEGLWYFFDEASVGYDEGDATSAETIVVTDKPQLFETLDGESEIVYRSKSGLHERFDEIDRESIHHISQHRTAVPQHVHLKNYNYRTPEVDLSSAADVDGGLEGTVYGYGGSYKTVDEAEAVAQHTASQFATGVSEVQGKGNCRALRAGKRFDLIEHAREVLNDGYVVTGIRHRGTHNPLGQEQSEYSYTNEFNGFPTGRLDVYRPPQQCRKPRANGIITAPIEGNGGEYAAIDDVGRYKVRMPFDISSAGNYEASKYIRLAQPYSGSDYGIHFPSHEGTEMVLACVDGDPDKPIGLGTVPNANTASPVKSSNKEKSIIRTAAGNEFELDDTKDKQKITLKTAAVNALLLDDAEDRAAIQTTDKNALLLDDKNQRTVLNAKEHVMKMSYDSSDDGITISTSGGHVIKVDDKNKMVTIQSSKGHTVQMDDNGGKMVLTDSKNKSTVTLDGSKGLVLDSMGEISINAMKDVTIKGQNVNISTTSGKIEAKATQDLNLSGMKISEKATTDLRMEGMNVGIKANMKATTEANMGVEIKSNLQTKVSGTMTEVSGQAMTTVKGGVVMIN